MSKIICDICGTTYPETADQCPICGYAKPAQTDVVASDIFKNETAERTYTPVKGGRFSKNNVRKRNHGAYQEPKAFAAAEDDGEDLMAVAPTQKKPVAETNREKNINRFLVITAVALLLAIIAVVVYIALRFFAPDFTLFKPNDSTNPATTGQVQEESGATQSVVQTHGANTGISIPCEGISLADTNVEMTVQGQLWLLNYSLSPADTTDTVSFTSSDPSVAMVNDEGRVTAVGPGAATITITCGDYSAKCEVIGNFAAVPGTTNPNATVSVEGSEDSYTNLDGVFVDPNEQFEVLFYGYPREDNDVTMFVGSVVDVVLQDSQGNNAPVTWTTEDTDIVLIEGNNFTALAAGVADISTTYGNKTYEIIFRVY